MTVNENRNYLIPILCSIAFHLLLCFLYFPQNALPTTSEIETLSVGLFEVSSEFNLSEEQDQVVAPTNESVIETKPSIRKEVVQKTGPKPENNRQKPVPQKSGPSVNPGESANTPSDQIENPSAKIPETGGKTGNTEVKSPVGLGSGEGMVFNQGTLPRYPKNAMNEGVEGEVKVRVFVDSGGGLEKADLLETSGDSRLDKVTVSSLERGWKFKPETEKYYIDLVFSFRIKTGISILFINSETRP